MMSILGSLVVFKQIVMGNIYFGILIELKMYVYSFIINLKGAGLGNILDSKNNQYTIMFFYKKNKTPPLNLFKTVFKIV